MTPEERRIRVQQRLDELYQHHATQHGDEIATYYSPDRGYYMPDHMEPEHQRFAVSLATVDGKVYQTGDIDTPFPLQSLSKVFVHGVALEMCGREHVLQRVGVEPSGDAFNSISIVLDERHNRPYNPMVNAGALVTTDLVEGRQRGGGLDRILYSMRRYAGNNDLRVDETAFDKMLADADRNRAMSYLMRSFDMISEDVEENLAIYLRHCAVNVTTQDLAIMAATLANGGRNPVTGEQALQRPYVRDVLSVMYMCGMYDFAGQWAYRIGIPAKSGVSGGIMAVVPGKLGIAVYSPGLDEYGNSVRGIKVCEEISERLGLHVFATDDEDALLGDASTPDA